MRDTDVDNRYWNDMHFQDGYDSRCLDEPLDPLESKGWKEGWNAADSDLAKDQ